jgi:hypothetical protein
MSVCELRFAFKTRLPSAVISKLDKSVIISPSTGAIKLRGKLQAKQDLALKQGNDYYDYITGEVKSNANAQVQRTNNKAKVYSVIVASIY